jgi:hypothetical protein
MEVELIVERSEGAFAGMEQVWREKVRDAKVNLLGRWGLYRVTVTNPSNFLVGRELQMSLTVLNC